MQIISPALHRISVENPSHFLSAMVLSESNMMFIFETLLSRQYASLSLVFVNTFLK